MLQGGDQVAAEGGRQAAEGGRLIRRRSRRRRPPEPKAKPRSRRRRPPKAARESHETYVMEAMLDWNGPATTECEDFLTASLNRHFDSQTWHFRTEMSRSMKSVSAVIDNRLKDVTSKLPFVVS